MLKIMIVDDEAIVRIGVKSCINWEKNGFKVVGEASNGEEALQLVDKLKPDIILTDIKMPIVDGIELIKRIKLKFFDIKIVVLSCLNEYEYVREAMKYGAIDYLFKPTMSPDDILNVLTEVKDKILEEKVKSNEIRRLKDTVDQSLDLLKQEFFNNMIYNNIESNEEIYRNYKKWNIPLREKHLICLILEFDDYVEMKEKYTYEHLQMFYRSCQNTISEILKQYNNGTCFIHENKKIIVLFNVDLHSEKEIHRKVIELSNKIIKGVKNYIDICISIGISNIFDDFRNINNAFKQANQALSQKFILGKGKIIKFEDIQVNHENLIELFSTEINNLFEVIKLKDTIEINENIHELLTEIKNKVTPQKEEICNLAISIVIESLRIYRNEVLLEEFFGDQYNMIYDVYKNDTFNEVEEWLKSIISKLFINVENKYSPVIREAIEYIMQNYTEEISLTSIANHVNMSKNYFSKIFKDETGVNFVRYLANMRIEYAKELLIKENYRTYEVAELVGYKNYRYFCKIFKKITDKNPSDMKKQQ